MAPDHASSTPVRQLLILGAITVVIVAGVAWLAISLLGDGSSKPAPRAPVTAGAASAYGSVEELHQAAVAAGSPCPRWTQTTVVTLAAESGHCSGTDLFATYATPEDQQRQLDSMKGTDQLLVEKHIDPGVTLVGANWTITGPAVAVQQLRSRLGGTIVDHRS